MIASIESWAKGHWIGAVALASLVGACWTLDTRSWSTLFACYLGGVISSYLLGLKVGEERGEMKPRFRGGNQNSENTP